MKLKENQRYVKIGVTIFLTILACMVCAFLLFNMKGIASAFHSVLHILQSFIFGGAIAYLLTPLCRGIENRLMRVFGAKRETLCRGIAILISILFGLVLMALLIIIVMPQLWQSVIQLARELPGELQIAYGKLNELLEPYPQVQTWFQDVSQKTIANLEAWSKNDLLPFATSALSNVAGYLSDIIIVFKDLLLGLVISVYLMSRRKKFAVQGRMAIYGIFPQVWAERIEAELHLIDRMFNRFLTGKLLDSFLMGVMCFLGCLILKLPNALLISVIIGVTNIIPVFGPFIGAIPCALLLLLENPMHCLVFVIFTIIIQQIDGNFLGPRIVGNSTGLSGFWVTFSIVLFGGFWGISGMLIGVPLFAVIYDLIRRLIYRALRRRGKDAMISDYQVTFHPEELAQPAPAKPKRKLPWRREDKKK